MAGICPCVLLVKFIGMLPPTAGARKSRRRQCAFLLAILPRLRNDRDVQSSVPFPDGTDARRNETLHQMTLWYLAWQAVEFALPEIQPGNIEPIIEIEGHGIF